MDNKDNLGEILNKFLLNCKEATAFKNQNFIVQEESFLTSLRAMALVIDNQTPDFRLLFGPRGAGKSTLIFYVEEGMKKQKNKFPVYTIDFSETGANEPDPHLLKSQIESVTGSSLHSLLKIDQGYKIFFIDNLDRYYETDDEISKIRKLFKTLEPTFKGLIKNSFILVTCAPEWRVVLDDPDISYLDFQNHLELKPFSKKGLTKILERRVPDGYKLCDLADRDAIDLIIETSRGNPRKLLQITRSCTEVAARKNKIMDKNLVEEMVGDKTLDARLTTLKEFAMGNPERCYIIGKLRRLNTIIQQKALDPVKVADALNQRRPVKIDEKIEDALRSTGFLYIHYGKEKKWAEVYQAFLDDIKKIGKPNLLYQAYFQKPFILRSVELYQFLQKIEDLYRTNSTAVNHINSLVYKIGDLERIEGEGSDIDNRKKIQLFWEAIQDLAIAIVIFNNPEYPREPKVEWKNASKFRKLSRELSKEIETLYSSYAHQFEVKADFEFVRTSRNTCLHDTKYSPDSTTTDLCYVHMKRVVDRLLTRFSNKNFNPVLQKKNDIE